MSKIKSNLTKEEKVKIKEAKKELNEYRENIKYIEEKLNDAEEVKAKVLKVTTTLSFNKTNTSSSNDKFADAISRLNDLQIDCSQKMKDLLIKKFLIDEKIEKVDQPYRNVLFCRYVRGFDWDDVALKVGYTKDYVSKELHREALYLYSKEN